MTDTSGYQSVPQLIQDRQIALGKTDRQLAEALGYKENVIVMMKKGIMRMPLGRVADFASVLEVDKMMLLRLVVADTPGPQ